MGAVSLIKEKNVSLKKTVRRPNVKRGGNDSAKKKSGNWKLPDFANFFRRRPYERAAGFFAA
jgi:hypothetical protein